MRDIREIKREYITTSASMRQLAEKYGVSRTTLERASRKEGWTELRRQRACRVEEKILDSSVEAVVKRGARIEAVADKLLTVIEAGIEDGTLLQSQRAMRDLSGALRDIRDIKGIKSEADLQEQLARIAKLRKEAQTEERPEVRVIISGEAEQYSE